MRLTPHPNPLPSKGRGDRSGRNPFSAQAVSAVTVSAFTIIELLVVVSIITLLISLLLPGLSKSKENARRAVCAANSRSQVIAADAYSVENRGYLPPANSASAAQKAWSFDLRDSFAAAPKVPLGMGLPLALGFFDFQPEAFHCPSMDTSKATQWSTPYHSMNTTIPNWWNSVGANWWKDPAYANFRITIAYSYRAASWWATHGTGDRFLQRERQPGSRVINVDIVDPRFGRRYTHIQGYNYTRIDESGDWFADDEGVLEQIPLGSGAIVVDGWGSPATDELVFTRLELGK